VEVRSTEGSFGSLEETGLTEDDLLFVKELIHPRVTGLQRTPFRLDIKGKNFLYEIVSNSVGKRPGFDGGRGSQMSPEFVHGTQEVLYSDVSLVLGSSRGRE
jgi:hypothetical protein